jgi:hypothetical protein
VPAAYAAAEDFFSSFPSQFSLLVNRKKKASSAESVGGIFAMSGARRASFLGSGA